MSTSSQPPAPTAPSEFVPVFKVKIRGPVAIAHEVRTRRARDAARESTDVVQAATERTIARATRALHPNQTPPVPAPKPEASALRNVAPEDRAEPWTAGVSTEQYAGLDVLRHLANGRPTPILDATERHQGHSDAISGRKPSEVQRKSGHYMLGFEAGAKALGKTVDELLGASAAPAGAPAAAASGASEIRQPTCLRDVTLRQQGHSDAREGKKPSDFHKQSEWYMAGYNKGLKEKSKGSKRWGNG